MGLPDAIASRDTTIALVMKGPGRASTVNDDGHVVIREWLDPMVMSALRTPSIAGCPGATITPWL